MDQEAAQSGQGEAFPIFDVYRRGYDPEQVDRYIAEQQRRLDETQQRASESERKLAAAVGQLRELHRRVAMLEGEERQQGPSLDMLGERVQRILQEAWEGAYALRQSAEREVTDQREQADRDVAVLREQVRDEVTSQREQAEREVAELLDAAQRRAALMRAETDRRRQAYLDRVEEDRARAVNQITYLYDQRQLALGELSRIQASIESTVGEMAKSPLGVPSISSRTGPRSVPLDQLLDDEAPVPAPRREPRRAPAADRGASRMPGLEQPISAYGTDRPERAAYGTDRPASVADRPEYGTDRPEYGTDRPEYGTDRPEYGTDRPPTSGVTVLGAVSDEPSLPVAPVVADERVATDEHVVVAPRVDEEYVPAEVPAPSPRHRAERRPAAPPRVFDFDDE